MGLGKFFKKLFKKILPFLPLILLFTGGFSAGAKLFNFTKEAGLKTFIKKNIFKALVWGYSIYKALNPKQPPAVAGGDYAGEPTYSWQGATVTSQQNVPVQVVYGDWWVDNGNVIDKEITTSAVVDPTTSLLYLTKVEVMRNGKQIGSEVTSMDVRNPVTIENGQYKGYIIGFDEVSGNHCFFDPNNPGDGWVDFETVTIGTNPYPNFLNIWWKSIFTTVKNSGKLAHNKFVFTPDFEAIYSFMNYEFASTIMFRLDIATKKLYLYQPYSILHRYDSGTGNYYIFDYSGYNSQLPGYDRTLHLNVANNTIASGECNFHIANSLRQYTATDTYTYTTNYMPDYDVRQNSWITYPTTTKVVNFQRDLQLFNSSGVKILDGIVHWHEELGEFSMQILIDDFKNNIHVKSCEIAKDIPGDTRTEPAPSASAKRYMVGLRYFKNHSILRYDNSVTTDIQSSFEANEDFYNAYNNLGFFGLVCEFESFTSNTLTPTARQSEIYNLAYLSFSKIYKSSAVSTIYYNPSTVLRDGDIYTNPFPSIDAHIYKDRSPRIEKLAKQPQFRNWYQRDENGFHIGNKSIGAIVSLVVKDPNTLLPRHVSYSYFSSQCYALGDSRFDPFFIEITNFSNLYRSAQQVETKSFQDPNAKLYPGANTVKSQDGKTNPLATRYTFADILSAEYSNTSTKVSDNVVNILTDGAKYQTGGGTSWDHYGSLRYTQPTYAYRPTKPDIIFNSMMDKYFYDYTGVNNFLDYNDTLVATDIVFVPEHSYHLVKVENTWFPIRGWSSHVGWYIQEHPAIVYPLNILDLPQYVSDGENQTTLTSLWTSRKYYLDSTNDGYNENQSYFFHNNPYVPLPMTSPTPSGYVWDEDGQIPFATPRIINGKVYWFDNDEIYKNITDYQIQTQISETFRKVATTNFITAGWWGGWKPGEYQSSHNLITAIPTADKTKVIYQQSFVT